MSKIGLSTRVAVTALIGGATAIAMAAPAGASSSPSSPSSPASPHLLTVKKVVASGFVAPLQFAVNGSDIYVADSAAATLSKVTSSGTTVLAHSTPQGGGDTADLSGVAFDARRGNLAYTTSTSVGDEGAHTAAAVTILQPGKAPVVADLLAYEKAKNPDKVIHYGVQGTATQCQIDALNAAGLPLTYTGQIDSHPYALAALSDGSFAVADAGGNDILKVDRKGNISQLRVMPAQAVTITPELAAENGLPACVAGLVYRFESVPTDVEVGPAGVLYVSLLPGAFTQGAIYTVDEQQHLTKIAGGLDATTNLAVDPHGTVYAAEFTGHVVKIVNGKGVPVFDKLGVVGIEYVNGQIYVSTAPALFADPNSTTPPPPGQILLLG